MQSEQLRNTVRAVSDHHSDRSLSGTPFYKPTGRFFDAGIETDHVSHPSSAALHIGRLLLASYENEYIFIPDEASAFDLEKWERHYSRDRLFRSHQLRHTYEDAYFRDLSHQVDITGDWSLHSFRIYLEDYLAKLDAADSRAIVERIRSSKSPQHAARFHAIQLTCEFLVESSGMTRNLQGYYGPEQSEYFKIVIDEYGYGVHDTKHSTLYKHFMESIGLCGRPHKYWWFYLPVTVFSYNYINASCSNHVNFFRHLGSLTQSECAFASSLMHFDVMYREIFDRANTAYFREHVHIDQHHGRMGIEGLCVSLIERIGESIIPKIVRGFEDGQYLSKVYRTDLCAHLDWVDSLWSRAVVDDEGLSEDDPEFFSTVMDASRVLSAISGTVRVYVMPWIYVPLNKGESLSIPARVLFGISVGSDGAYQIDQTV
jgi:hypothetical protein